MLNERFSLLSDWQETFMAWKRRLEYLFSVINAKIIEDSGSNANGEYMKFADGTMICYYSGELITDTAVGNVFGSTAGTMYYGSTTWTFPIEFTSTPKVVATSTLLSLAAPNVKVRNIAITNCVVAGLHNAVSVAITFDIMAIGTWK